MTLTLWSYNLGPGRDHEQVDRELVAILATTPAVVGLQEALGYGSLPDHPDYVKFRDRSNESRTNVAAYVRRDLVDPDRDVRWRDLVEQWKRTKHPGMHPPRSWLELPTRFQCVTGHQPPKLPPRSGGPEATVRCQTEGIDYLTRRLGPWLRGSWRTLPEVDRERAKDRPRVVLADWNRTPYEHGPGPKSLAAAVDGLTVGTKIDGAVIRGECQARDEEYLRHVGDIELRTDHPWGAFRFNLAIDPRWE